MRRFAPPCLLVLAFLPLVAGCGEDGPAPAPSAEGGPPAAESDWSDPSPGTGATGRPEPVEGAGAATGTPDGSAVGSPEALLARLRARVAGGRGMGDADYERDVRDVAEVLWPSDADAAARAGAQVHVQVAAIAAEVSGWLAAGEDARAARAKTNAVDLEVHDAFLAATAGGPDAYRSWCEAAGAALLKKLAEARRARFFPPR